MSDTPARSVSSRRDLPARASLEHLRNEAKAHLRTLRQEKPATRLSGAQLDIARSYGFSSWRALKTYVDALHSFGAQIIQAVREGDLPTIRRILDHYPELVNASTDLQQRVRPSDTFAMRLIHLAIAENQTDVAHLLIERGADVNARNTDGRLPLHDCFELGRDHLVPILLSAGARPDVCAAAAYGMHDRLREILQRDPRQANDLTTGESPARLVCLWPADRVRANPVSIRRSRGSRTLRHARVAAGFDGRWRPRGPCPDRSQREPELARHQWRHTAPSRVQKPHRS